MAEKGLQQGAPPEPVATELRAMDLTGEPLKGNPMATVERESSLIDGIPGGSGDDPEGGDGGGGGGAPSGSITHPGEEELARDENGTWTYQSADGTLYRWDDSVSGWRDFLTGELNPELPVPEELAHRLSKGGPTPTS